MGGFGQGITSGVQGLGNFVGGGLNNAFQGMRNLVSGNGPLMPGPGAAAPVAPPMPQMPVDAGSVNPIVGAPPMPAIPIDQQGMQGIADTIGKGAATPGKMPANPEGPTWLKYVKAAQAGLKDDKLSKAFQPTPGTGVPPPPSPGPMPYVPPPAPMNNPFYGG